MAKQQAKKAGVKPQSKSKSAKQGAKSVSKKPVKAAAKPGSKFSNWDEIIKEITSVVERNMNWFVQADEISNSLTGKDRLRLFSARSRNYGFIDKAFDIARDNPSFMPPNFDVKELYVKLRALEDLRQLMLILQSFLQLVTSSFMLQADDCYRDALRIYNSLREQKNGRVPGAAALFDTLEEFFKRRHRAGDEPTEKQLERDIKRLLHGHADGEIVIENERPKITAGSRKVVDNVRTGRVAVKEKEEINIKE